MAPRAGTAAKGETVDARDEPTDSRLTAELVGGGWNTSNLGCSPPTHAERHVALRRAECTYAKSAPHPGRPHRLTTVAYRETPT